MKHFIPFIVAICILDLRNTEGLIHSDDYYEVFNTPKTPEHTMTKFKGFGVNCEIGVRYKAVRSGLMTEEEKQMFLSVHNGYRRKVANGEELRGSPGPQPPAEDMVELTWDEELSAIAQRWAEQCPGDGNLHDENRQTEHWISVGQNIFEDSIPSPEQRNLSLEAAVNAAIGFWYEEVFGYNSSDLGPFNSTKDSKTSFSQLVWAHSKKVGCGAFMSRKLNAPDKYTAHSFKRYIVCNYGPGGNINGLNVYEEGTPASNCPAGTKDNNGLCSPACPSNELQCDDGVCIKMEKYCDGIPHCINGDDEENCASDTNRNKRVIVSVMCYNSRCWCHNEQFIPSSWKCDKYPDCNMGEDERDCFSDNAVTNATSITTTSTTTTPVTATTTNATLTKKMQDMKILCNKGECWCNDGKNIPRKWTCDGFLDCPDGEDERDCGASITMPSRGTTSKLPLDTTTTTAPSKVAISTTPLDSLTATTHSEATTTVTPVRTRPITSSTVTTTLLPSGTTTTTTSSFPTASSYPQVSVILCNKADCWCNNGNVIPTSWKCDGIPDCTDQEDEWNCVTTTTTSSIAETTTATSMTMMPTTASTATIIKSTDAAPSVATTTNGKLQEFSILCKETSCICKNGYVISLSWKCDGIPDCSEKEDEINCGSILFCKKANCWCSNGKVIPLRWKCDGIQDCFENEDEKNCVFNTASTATTITAPSTTTALRTSSMATAITTPSTTNTVSTPSANTATTMPSTVTTTRSSRGTTTVTPSLTTTTLTSATGAVTRTATEAATIRIPLTAAETQTPTQGISVLRELRNSRLHGPLIDCDERYCWCNNGNAIPMKWKCDGIPDCFRKEDEKGCAPSKTSTTITPSKTVTSRSSKITTTSAPLTAKSMTTTLTSSPEVTATTASPQGLVLICDNRYCWCNNGITVPVSWRCDGIPDCSNKEDERGCAPSKTTNIKPPSKTLPIAAPSAAKTMTTTTRSTTTATPEEVTVTTPPQGSVLVCDETNCWCNNGNAIPVKWRCDGIPDCSNKEDERRCATSASSTTPCPLTTATTVPLTVKPPTIASAATSATPSQATATADLPRGPALVCGERHCWCINGNAIPIRWRCDGIPDCSNTEDERGCVPDTTATPSAATFTRTSASSTIKALTMITATSNIPSHTTDTTVSTAGGTTVRTTTPSSITFTTTSPVTTALNEPTVTERTITTSTKATTTTKLLDTIASTTPKQGPTIICKKKSCWCSNGNVIQLSWKCDGIPDCPNAEDEKTCGPTIICNKTECLCNNGKVIPVSWKCDGIPDCSNVEDEKHCVSGVIPTSSKATNGTTPSTSKTIATSAMVTTTPASLTATSTHSTVTSTASPSVISTTATPQGPTVECNKTDCRCTNGKIIPLSWKCDGILDCPNKEDERQCKDTPCQAQCNDGECIPSGWKCDGITDCATEEDEHNCLCDTETEFECANGKCIPKFWACDMRNDCGDGSDEDCMNYSLNSTFLAAEACNHETEFRCRDGSCIPRISVCDLKRDCAERSDEDVQLCRRHRCKCSEFQCDSGRCIPLSWQCNEIVNCPHQEDEKYCTNLEITRYKSREYHGPCNEDIECATRNATCINNVCVCDSKSVYNEGYNFGECVKIPTGIQESCSVTLQCTSSRFGDERSIVCSKAGKCICKKGFIYDTQDKRCKILQAYEGECNRETVCSTENAMCISGKCSCSSTYVYYDWEYYDECLKIVTSMVDTCINEIQCTSSMLGSLESIACSKTTGRCICKKGFRFDNSIQTCIKIIEYEETCNCKTTCSTINALCISGRCRCDSEHVYNDEGYYDECLKIATSVEDSCSNDLQCTSSTLGQKSSIACSKSTGKCVCIKGFVFDEKYQNCKEIRTTFMTVLVRKKPEEAGRRNTEVPVMARGWGWRLIKEQNYNGTTLETMNVWG